MFEKMNFGKGVTYKSIDFNVNPQIPLLVQIDELKEDLIQVQYGNLLLDVGWYSEFKENGQFRVKVIRDNLWDNPIVEKRCRDLSQLDKNIKECIGYIQKYERDISYFY